MYSSTPLVNGSVTALFIVITVIAAQLSNAFHVYDIAVSSHCVYSKLSLRSIYYRL